MLKTVLLYLGCFFVATFQTTTSSALADGHHIEIKIKGFSDSTCYLAYRLGNKTLIKDTVAGLTQEETIVFQGEATLPPGIYILVSQEKESLFEFIVDLYDQRFTIIAEPGKELKLTFKRSAQNTGFELYRIATGKFNNERSEMRKELGTLKPGSEPHKKIALEIKVKIKRFEKLRLELIDDYPETLFACILTASINPKVPKAPEGADDGWKYRWYKDHYWDNIDFDDDRIARTPIYQGKLKYYFEKMVAQHPDSINFEVDKLLTSVQDGKELYKQSFTYLYKKYNSSKILCIDKVFVNLALNWYTKEFAYWTTDVQRENVHESAERLGKYTCGSPSPIVDLLTVDGDSFDLSVKNGKYKLLYFWKKSCPECAVFESNLVDAQRKYSVRNFEVVSIYTGYNYTEWHELLGDAQHGYIDVIPAEIDQVEDRVQNVFNLKSAPYMILLDLNNHILLKGCNPDQLNYFLENIYKED